MLEIAEVALFEYSLSFKRTVTLKGIAFDHRNGLLLRLTSTAGEEGWGEIAPLLGFSRESLREAKSQIALLAPRLCGIIIPYDWNELDGAFAHRLDAEVLVASVRYGIETSVWDLMASHLRRPLHKAWSETARREVPLNALLLGNTGDVATRTSRLVRSGYKAIKLKVGQGRVQDDIESVNALLATLPTDVSLRLDANQQWHFEEALSFADGVDGGRIEYIEEPLADNQRLSEFVAHTGWPVALDESLVGWSPETLALHRYAQAVILKPMLLGGPIPTMRTANQALALGMRPVLSAAFESGIGTRANIALAANTGVEAVPAGLSVYTHLAEDVFDSMLRFTGANLDADDILSAQRNVDMSRCKRV